MQDIYWKLLPFKQIHQIAVSMVDLTDWTSQKVVLTWHFFVLKFNKYNRLNVKQG